MLASHYAPRTPLEVWPTETLQHRINELLNQKYRFAIRSLCDSLHLPHQTTEKPVKRFECYRMPSDPIDYADCLDAKLNQLDINRYDGLLIEMPPDLPNWLAVHDRLQRASYHFVMR